ncbi:MAG: ribonuclease P protein component [Oligoflexia bacterium]|nr:ribonuclease P protein component [Oligoflexia bacterium]
MITYNFSKKRRLLQKSDFLKIRSGGSKRVFRHWVLFYLKNEDSIGRLGISVQKKYGSSVERNQFRRFIREYFRKNHEFFKGYDLHFVAKQKKAELGKIRYKAELKDDFSKLIHWIS